MANSSQIIALIKSHLEGDDSRFRLIATQLAAAEAKSGHAVLSRTISSLLKENSGSYVRHFAPLNNDLSEFVLQSADSFRLSNLIVSDIIRGRIERILKEYKQRELLYKNGLHNRSKILLTGPSGTGKTMTASILANELQLPLYIVRLEKVITKYMGESSLKLGKVFELISQVRGVYLFDEFDAIGSQRRNENEVGEMRRILNTFLQMLERENSESIIIAATNNPEVLDVALRRRFDDVIGYDLPDDARRLRDALDDPEGIGEILQIKITPELTDGNSVEFNPFNLGNQILFGAVGRADVVDFPAVIHEPWYERQIWRDVAGSAAAGQDNLFHYAVKPSMTRKNCSRQHYSMAYRKSF